MKSQKLRTANWHYIILRGKKAAEFFEFSLKYPKESKIICRLFQWLQSCGCLRNEEDLLWKGKFDIFGAEGRDTQNGRVIGLQKMTKTINRAPVI